MKNNISHIELQTSEEDLKLLITQMPLGLAVHEIICNENGFPIDYRFMSVNRKFKEQFEVYDEDIIGKTVLEVFPKIEKYWIETYGKVALTAQPLQYDYYSVEFDKYFSISAYSPRAGQFALISTDVTMIKKVDREFLEKTEELERFFTVNLDLLCIADIKGHFIRTNRAWEKILDYSEGYLKGKNFLDFVHPDDIPRTLNALSKLKDQEHVLNFVNQYRCSDGTYRHMEWNLLPSANLIYGVARDITERQQKQDEIEYLSFHDYLTGLYNRRYMEDATQRLDVERNLPLAIMMLDVNGLKFTNDIFGHKMGDQLLKAVADILVEVCRADDIICRIGGDEFAILLPSTNEMEANAIKQRINKATLKANMDSVVVSVAIGYAVKTHKDENMDNIKMSADSHMYQDKRKHGYLMKAQTIDQVVRNINLNYHCERLHGENVSKYCNVIANKLQLGDIEVTRVTKAGLLHDIGKVVIAPGVMNERDNLTVKEFEQIKRHPSVGYQMLQSVDEFAPLAKAVLSHHERWDGKGYPEGLKASAIPLEARILAVADAYTNMIEKQDYEKIKTRPEAILELKLGSGTQFDPHITKIFIDYLHEIS